MYRGPQEESLFFRAKLMGIQQINKQTKKQINKQHKSALTHSHTNSYCNGQVTSLQSVNLLIRNSYTHVHTPVEQRAV